MSNEVSIDKFIRIIQKLPFDANQGKWLRWLSEYHTPGYYNRQVDKRRNAEFAYSHLANSEMLLWIVKAANVNKNLVALARSESSRLTNKHQKSAAIRKHVPWSVLESALQKITGKIDTHWLQYWKPFQIEPATSEPWLLTGSAGNQLAKVQCGDVVWIISVDFTGRLITLGPIRVNKIVGQREAEALLGTEVWPADWHIISDPENTYYAECINLSSVASQLRFVSKDHPEILLSDGKVNVSQFQQMRKLTPESAELITKTWYTIGSTLDISVERLKNDLDRLSSLDEKREIIGRREQNLLRRTLFRYSSVGRCGVCGSEYPVSLLVAAHIKPRANCSDPERRDIHNLMPLCLLGCDSLFEHGFISVDKGYVIAGPNEAKTADLNKYIESVLGSSCDYWSAESKKYFEWRAKHPTRIE